MVLLGSKASILETKCARTQRLMRLYAVGVGMANRERDEHGQIKALDPETVLEVFEARDDPCEPLDAGDVADELGWARRTALKKLDKLSEAGVLADKKVGARGRVWWVPGAVDLTNAPDEDEIPAGWLAEAAVIQRDAACEETETDADPVAEVDVPGSGAKAEKRRDAIQAAFGLLRAEGSVSTSELRETAWEADSDTYASPESLWTNAVRPALADLQGTDSGGEGSHSWEFVGNGGAPSDE